MEGVPEEEDCFGKLYSSTAPECQDCDQWQECKQLTEDRQKEESRAKAQAAAVEERKQKALQQKREEYQTKAKQARTEGKEKPTPEELKAKLPEKEDIPENPYEPGSGAHFAFEALKEGGTKNELIEYVRRKCKEIGRRAEPRNRVTRVIKAIQNQNSPKESLAPFDVKEEGAGSWRVYRLVRRRKE